MTITTETQQSLTPLEEDMKEVVKSIKQKSSVEFICCLSRFDDGKTLGGKSIKIKIEKIEKKESNEETIDENPKFTHKICNKSYRLQQK